MRSALLLLSISIVCTAGVNAGEDLKLAEEHRQHGIVALQESQKSPRQIVNAARHFAKAAAIFEKVGEKDCVVEMNSFLYWCKKKMTLDDIEAFTKGGEAIITQRLKAAEEQKVDKLEAQNWFDRAEAFAKAKPGEHLLIAIRFFEVAERFKGTDAGMAAIDRSLKAMQQIQSADARVDAPPAVAAPATEMWIKSAKGGIGRKPVPDANQLKEAEATVKDIFKQDYAKTAAADKKALGQKLLQQADENKDDPVSRFVLLQETAAVAAAAGDAETALRALDALGQGYDVDTAMLKAEALAKVVPVGADASKNLARLYLKAIDDAVAEDNYEAAAKMLTTAEAIVKKTQEMPLITKMVARGKEVRALQADFAKVKAAQQALAAKPDDPDASATIGKFLCFNKNEWAAGLPFLMKGSDAALKELAEKDLRSTDTVDDQVKLGDAWWDYAEKLAGSDKKAVLSRADLFYTTVLYQTSGLPRARIEKRLQEIPPAATLVVWNSNNGGLGSGAREFNVYLYEEGIKVWSQKNIPIEWKKNEEVSLTLRLPPLPFTRVRVHVTKVEGQHATLSELQVFKNGVNIAAAGKARASSFYENRTAYAAANIIDGKTDSKVHGGGTYWHPWEGGHAWVEVILKEETGAKPVPLKIGGVVKELFDLTRTATYKPSSRWKALPPLPNLLNGSGGGYHHEGTPGGETFAFATDHQNDPNIVIDLGRVSSIERVIITNRKNAQDQAAGIALAVAQNEQGPWQEVWVSSSVENEWVIDRSAVGRYVKLWLKGKRQHLCLYAVQVLGK